MDNPPSRKPPAPPQDHARTGAADEQSGHALLRECRVDTFRAGGAGGQHQNKVESGVRLTHRRTGIVVSSRRHRSQHRNREDALRKLREKLVQLDRTDPPRLPTRVPRGQRRKRLDDKKKRSRLKRLRKRPAEEDG